MRSRPGHQPVGLLVTLVLFLLAASSAAAEPGGLTQSGGTEGSCPSAGGTFAVNLWVEGTYPNLHTEPRGIELPPASWSHWAPRKLARLDVVNGCDEALILYFTPEGEADIIGVALPGTDVSLDREELDAIGLRVGLIGWGSGCCMVYPDEFAGIPVDFVLGP